MKPRIVVIGATGVFGERLARRLAGWPDINLVLAARGRDGLGRLASDLGGAEVAVFDRACPEALATLAPFAVIDCAGPFQGADYRVAEAALSARAHYIDIADARGFVAGFPDALDAAARRSGRFAITGASSAPALSCAAVDCLTAGWSRVDAVVAGISPGARALNGLSMIEALSSWAGRPVRVFEGGAWRARPGFGLGRWVDMVGLGRRRLSLAETPDLDLMVARFTPRREALFLAGHEMAAAHLGLGVLTWPVRLRLIGSLRPWARPLRAVAETAAQFGSDRGGMVVEASGLNAAGAAVTARWSLWAERGVGPNVPTLAAGAVLRALLDGDLREPRATACVGVVSLEAILAQAKGLPIKTRTDHGLPGQAGLWRRVLGEAFDSLPAPVRRVHFGLADETFHGRALSRGSGGAAAVVRALAHMPRRGRHPDFSVRIAPTLGGEAWTRAFAGRRFASLIRDVTGDPGRFEESVGPLSFRLEAVARGSGFDWRYLGWRIGPLHLPGAWGPLIRARSYAVDGGYRFSVVVAHRWVGMIAAYAGRLSPEPPLKAPAG